MSLLIQHLIQLDEVFFLFKCPKNKGLESKKK